MRQWNSLFDAAPLFLAPKYHGILLDLLRQHVPGLQVWAYGSRATGRRLGRFSDLDLAVENKLPERVRGELLEALDESDLPIKVDLVELAGVDTAFAARIRPSFVVVQAGDDGALTAPAP